MRVLLTGMSGAGKSALVEELRRRGHAAYDADDDGFSEPRADGRWGWKADAVADLLARHADGLLFFAGCSEEQRDLPFDLRVLLTAPRSVLVDRLDTRTSNPYGRGPAERSHVLADLAGVEPLLRRSADLVLTTTAPPARVADRLLGSIAVRSRADELIASMTTAEKAGQLSQYFYFGALEDPSVGGLPSEPEAVEAALGRGEVGSLLFVTDPAEINRLQRLAVEGNRLGIPALFGYDVIHGLRTILPVPIAMAASWDPDTIERGQAVAAGEARAVGIHWAFAPMADIARDPRWGRIVEGAGEDPFLGAAVAAAQVRGLQGTGVGTPERVIAGPKHFAGYGAALGGRDYDEVDLSDSQLWNVYLPPFAAAVEAGAGNVMTAYMDLNGVPATGNAWLFTDVLRAALGFGGFVVSDANAVRNLVTHGFARDLTDAAARALSAGVDMEMAIADPAYAQLPEAVERGVVGEQALDASVRRVLEAKLRMGLFEAPYVDEDRSREVLADPAHREVARLAAERSAVLLRNQGELLPLDARAPGSIAVIGPLADSKRDTLGPWCFDYDLDETVTVLEGIRHRAGTAAQVEYAPGVRPGQRVFPSMFDMFPGNAPEDPEAFDDEAELQRAIDLARDADVAVVVAGEWQNMIGESASRSSLELPGRQLELLQAVVGTGTPVVLLVLCGRPVDLRWAAQHVPAILAIWYPGTQGGTAVANLLFGDVAPGGKLPLTWPRTVGQVPMVYSHTRSHEPEKQAQRYWDEESTPLFPFGHGLSYAGFEYRGVTVDRDAIAPDEVVNVSVDVSNAGGRAADEVVQLYIHQRHGSASRPVRELKGFQRLTLAAGETRTVRFALGPAELRYWSAAARDWVIDATTFDVWIGGDSTAEASATFGVTEA
jgi:beta-glucosidase